MFRSRLPVAAALLAFAGLAAAAPMASATSATATLSSGTLGFINSSPSSVSFSGTLNGVNQTLTSPQTLDVSDATGSGAGWNITATSTTFTASGSHTLPTGAVTLSSAPTDACDSGATCTLATNSVSYSPTAYTLPAGASAPTATKMYNAAANSGIGNQTITPTWNLAVPASAVAGNYSSTWTLSLVSGP